MTILKQEINDYSQKEEKSKIIKKDQAIPSPSWWERTKNFFSWSKTKTATQSSTNNIAESSSNTGNEQAKHQEWFTTFSELDSEKDIDFIYWLKNVKSKDLENFADPKWIKEKIASGEIDLDELRQAYQTEAQQKENSEQREIVVNIIFEAYNSQQEQIQQDAQIELSSLTPTPSNK